MKHTITRFPMPKRLRFPAGALVLSAAVHLAAAPPRGTWVNLADDGRLLYKRDSLGNRVPDFGDCGYMAGRAPIPEAPVKITLDPAEGDDRERIQSAIDQVFLTAGEYQLGSTLNLNKSGVVLRGVGASDSGTRLRATDPRQDTLVNVTSPAAAAPSAAPPRTSPTNTSRSARAASRSATPATSPSATASSFSAPAPRSGSRRDAP